VTALAIYEGMYVPRRDESAVEYAATKMDAAKVRQETTIAVAVAIRWCGTASCTPVMIISRVQPDRRLQER
jgi:hypothetical protein